MDILDKLFSRELQRRAGEKAIRIDANAKTAARKRSQELGKNAINASSKKPKRKTQEAVKKSSVRAEGSFFHRLNIRFPWLKLVAVVVLSVVVLADLLDFTISKVSDPYNKIKVAPMSRHVKATTRDLRGKKLVALTFDDGPSSATTPVLLDRLKEKEVYATFFMLGNMVKNNPDVAKRAKEEGHEIASHTMYHQNLIRISAGAIEADVNEANSVFRDTLGMSPLLTRPPYGNINDNVRRIAGMPLILWSVDTLDWKNRNVDAIVTTTLGQSRDGGIILMHDMYNTSIDAVPVLIDKLRESGYEFVTISELAKIRNVKLSSGQSYYNFYP